MAAAGAKVIAISRSPAKAGDLPAGVETRQCDVLGQDALQALLKAEAPDDILMSAATGGARAAGPFMEMDLNAYQGSCAKLWGYTNVVRYGAADVVDGGAIVLVSGTPARKGKPGQIAIASVGGAVEAFAREVAVELAPKRVLGATPEKLFILILLEELMLAVLGYIIEMTMGHISIEILTDNMRETKRYSFNGKEFLTEEFYVLMKDLGVVYWEVIIQCN